MVHQYVLNLIKIFFMLTKHLKHKKQFCEKKKISIQ